MSKRKIIIFIIIVVLLCITSLQFCVYQRADMHTDMTVSSSKFVPDTAPNVLFDSGHGNFHNINTTYEPFATLLKNDGIVIQEYNELFKENALKNIDLLIIANATSPETNEVGLKDAFSENEIIVLKDWIRQGGSLLLIADHEPFGSASASLAKAFGVGMANVWTVDTLRINPKIGKNTWLEYTLENGGLGQHSILQTDNPELAIDQVITFTGQSLSYDSTWTPILKLSNSAQNYYTRENASIASIDSSTYFNVPRQAQLIARSYGDGRIVVAGEAAMFTAQVARMFLKTARVGFNFQNYDNKNLVLNIIHWLLFEIE